MPLSDQPTPAMAVLARQLYADDVPVSEISAQTGMKKWAVYYWVDGGPKGPRQLPPIPRRRSLPPLQSGAPAARAALVARLWRAARMQVDDIELRLVRAGQGAGDASRESDARMLAVLVKTLRELTTLDAAPAGAGKAGAPTQADAENDSGPPDIDEFRRELARRMDAIVARRKAGTPGGTETGRG